MIYEGGAAGGRYEDPRWYEDDPTYCKRIADAAVGFFAKRLTHTAGRWAGKPFGLLGWQEHRLIRPIFGLLERKPSKLMPSGVRRIRKVYCEVPKKNGKTELVAGVGCKLLRADRELGAQVFSAARDKEQAGLIHGVSAQMIRNNPDLGHGVRINDSSKIIHFRRNGSFYQALSRDVPTKHGLNPHGVLFDELHAQPDSALWDILTEGSTVARVQPLIFAITTAGYDRKSICWRQREYAVRCLLGLVDDPAYLPVIYGMDEEDDWENEENWRRVNPSMGIIFTLDQFRKDHNEAKEMPHKINLFRRLRLNQWTRQETKFLPMDKWLGAPRRDSLDELEGELCYGGLDLSSVQDISAYVLLFPPSERRKYWDAVAFLFCPSAVVQVRSSIDRVPYDSWVRSGHVTTTSGNAIDYELIEQTILQSRLKYKLTTLGYDRKFAIQMIQHMDAAGIRTIPVGMGWLSMDAPLKELLRLLLEGQLRHGHNPVLDWMADNLVVKTDPAGNVKPAKDTSAEKIDGIVALCTAIYVANIEKAVAPSIYETRGVIAVGGARDAKKDEGDNGGGDTGPDAERRKIIKGRYGGK